MFERSRSFGVSLVVWILAGFLISALGFIPDTLAAMVQAGAATRKFQIDRKVPLAGFSRRGGRPAEGFHDPVGVRALVLEDMDTRLIIVSCDLLVVNELLYQAVREGINQRIVQDKETMLFLAATHTHSGPGAYGKRFLEKLSMGHYDPQVFKALSEQIIETIEAAARSLAPVRMAYGQDKTEGLVRNRVSEEGEVDSEIGVAAFRVEGKDAPLAVLINFSAHPTTLGAWNMRLSADYPGVACRAIEEAWPSTVCLFLVGAVGDQAPVKRGQAYEPAQRLGSELADTAIALIRKGSFQDIQDVRTQNLDFTLNPARVRLGNIQLPQWISARLVDDDATLSVAAIGPLIVAGVPCDMTAELGRRFKESVREKKKQAMLVGFVNDYIGYCISPELYDLELYESQMAFNGPDTGQQVIDRLMRMADALIRQQSKK